MTRSLLPGVDAVRHPWLAGQVWGLLVCLALGVFRLLIGQPLPFVSLAVLIGVCALGGVAMGAFWSVVTANERHKESTK